MEYTVNSKCDHESWSISYIRIKVIVKDILKLKTERQIDWPKKKKQQQQKQYAPIIGFESYINKRPKDHISCIWVQCAIFWWIGQGGHLIFPIGHEKHKLCRGRLDLASCQVSLNSIKRFQRRSRKCLWLAETFNYDFSCDNAEGNSTKLPKQKWFLTWYQCGTNGIPTGYYI